MNLSDITIVAAVDANYLKKLQHTYQTWLHHKPEILDMRLMIIYDADQLRSSNKDFDIFHKHKSLLLFPWISNSAESQREKMLSSLIYVPGLVINTPWYLKLDADTVATNSGRWFNEKWFQPDKSGEYNAFISNPWGYTKPVGFFESLEKWGDTTLPEYPRLEGRRDYEVKKMPIRAYYPRIISWLMFGNTARTKQAAELCPTGKLPIPSQDTYLHYVAARSNWRYQRERFSKMGWGHLGRKSDNFVQKYCEQVLQ